MKRDIDLERKILLKIEEIYDPENRIIESLKIDSFSMPIIAEHCKLLKDQGLIRGYGEEFGDDILLAFHVMNLTAQGYDYLELIRDDVTWEKIKKKVQSDNIPPTINFLSKIAGTFAGRAIKEMVE